MATSDNINHFPKFDGKNFSQWKFRLDLLLEEKQYKVFVEHELDEAVKKKHDTGISDADMKVREKKCKSLLASTISDEQLSYVMDKTTAKGMYDALISMFQRKSIASQLVLRRRLLTLKFSGNDINEHFVEFDKLVRELKLAGGNLAEIDIVVNLLLTLPKNYDALVISLEGMEETKLTLDYVKSRLLDEFAKRNGGSTHSKLDSGSAMHTKNPDIVCFSCGEKGHIKSRCFKNKKGKKRNFQAKKNSNANCASKETEKESSCLCAIRDIEPCVAHTSRPVNGSGGSNSSSSSNDKCNSNNNNVRNGNDKRTQAHALKSSKVDDATKVTFVLDSGATDHMANNKIYFDNLKRIQQINISVAKKNQKISANEQGCITVKTFHNGNSSIKTIENVLYMKDLKCNLMSIRRLTRLGYKVIFEGDNAIVSKNGKVVFTGRADDDLYQVEFNIERNIFAGIASDSVNQATQSVWHFRLGHINAFDLKKMINKSMVNGIGNINVNTDKELCESCVLGKDARKPFTTKNNIRSNRILELIHTDVCGPVSTPGTDGTRYFVTFTDDYSRASMVYCMRNKSDVLDKFREYVEMAEAQHGCKISKLRSDNGGEYTSNDFKSFCKSKGIQISYTAPYNPEMNSISERLNRTLQEKALSMLLAAGLERKYWNEAILAANYIKNRCPTSAYGRQFIDKTPGELWYGKKPDLSHIRVFGSICYNHIPSEKRKKFEAKASKCILLGYATNNAYRLWDIEKKKLVIGRNVTFNEKSVLNRTKMVEIFDSEAEIERDGELEAADDDDNEPLDHSTYQECTGDDQDKIHSTNRDCAGNDQEKINSVSPENTGNIDSELRRSSRERKKPERFGEVESHYAYSAQQYVNCDPESIDEAKQRDDWPDWKKAIDSEYASLVKNDTWTLCDLPKGRRAITGKWVFKLKHKANGEIDKYKARFVARGCSQKAGFDYAETYAPVAKLTTLRILLAVANRFDMYIHQMDVKSAFLNGDLDEDIFMVPPEGFEKGNKVCKLQKAIYGLKQASRMWNEKFNDFVIRIGFKRCASDYCLYAKIINGIRCYILLYVDDLLIVCDDEKMIQTIRNLMQKEFEMTDIGNIDTFLGMHIQHDREKGIIRMSQTQYLNKVLSKFGMDDCKPAATPIEKGLYLSNELGKTDSNIPYRELIGCLIYATQTTRPDLCAATNYFSRFQCCYTNEHFVHAKRALRYIKGSIDLNMQYVRDEKADKNDSKSTSGYVFKVFGNTVSWASRKQNTVAQSSAEAEFAALAESMNEAEWIRGLLIELGFTFDRPIIIHEDSQSCKKAAEAPREHKRMKHIAVKYDFVRDTIKKKLVQLSYIPTGEQTADIMTKGLARIQFMHLRSNLNLV